MTQSKSTKRSLVASGLALLVCVAMLIGSTFAWFTDSVVSTGNQIAAGNLQVDLVHVGGGADGADVSLKDNPGHPVFDYANWEPGYTVMETLRVENKGSLALQFRLDASTADAVLGAGGENLADVIDVYVYEGAGDAADTDSFQDMTPANGWRKAGTLSALMADADGLAHGVLLPENAEPKNQEPVGSVQMTVALHMQESAGNEYQSLSLGDLTFTLKAAQYTYEADGFGDDQYDVNAEYDKTDNGDGTYTDENGQLYVLYEDEYIAVDADTGVAGLFTDAAGNNYVSEGTAVNYVFSNAEEGENIVFIDDVVFAAQGSAPYLTAENATVDLNGRTVWVDLGENKNSFGVTGDGSVVKNGTFRCTGSRADYPLWVTGNTGRNHVTVENVTVEGGMQVTGTVSATLKNVTITANTYYDVYVAQDASVTVESGSFTHTGNMPHFYFFNYGARYNPTVIINGGTFSGGTPTYAVAPEFSDNPYTFTNNLG